MGCLPYVLDRFLVTAAQIDKYGCASPYNDVAQYFNQNLKEALAQLRKDLPLAAITYVDVYTVKYTLISQAKKYGMLNYLTSSLSLFLWKLSEFCFITLKSWLIYWTISQYIYIYIYFWCYGIGRI